MNPSPQIVGIRQNPCKGARGRMLMSSIVNLPPEGTNFIENDPGALPGVNRDDESPALPSAFLERNRLVGRAHS